MKRLLTFTVTVLGLALGLSSVSYSQDKVNALGVQLPIEHREAANQVHGDYSTLNDNSISNFFGVHLPLNKVESVHSDASYDDYASDENIDQYIVVFGVKIPYRIS